MNRKLIDTTYWRELKLFIYMYSEHTDFWDKYVNLYYLPYAPVSIGTRYCTSSSAYE
jgi:hypothetical protein